MEKPKSPLDEMGAGLDGLAQARAMLASGRKPGIARSLDFELVEIEAGRAVFSAIPGEHAYNPIGMVHGGYAATLLDSACGFAVHSKLSANQGYTTLDLNVSYLRPITKDTGPLRAEASAPPRAARRRCRCNSHLGRRKSPACSADR